MSPSNVESGRRDFDQKYWSQYDLPSGQYYTPDRANIAAEHIVFIDQGGFGITNSTSTKPVIGTRALNPCTAIILYNLKTKPASVQHIAQLDVSAYAFALSRIRSNDSEQVDVHIIGRPELCGHDTKILSRIVDAIQNSPRVTLQTFDVHDKPKPTGIAFDTRNGRLIRDTDLVKTYEEAYNIKGIQLFDKAGWEWDPVADFDGTKREHQKSRTVID